VDVSADRNGSVMARPSTQKIVELVLLLLLYGLCVALASTLWAQPAMLAACYVLVSILALLKWHTAADVISYVVAAILGPAGEAVVVHFGAWTYARPVLLIPLWLPLLWGIAGFFLRRFTWTVARIIRPHRE
jgi:hypothetical protein